MDSTILLVLCGVLAAGLAVAALLLQKKSAALRMLSDNMDKLKQSGAEAEVLAGKLKEAEQFKVKAESLARELEGARLEADEVKNELAELKESQFAQDELEKVRGDFERVCSERDDFEQKNDELTRQLERARKDAAEAVQRAAARQEGGAGDDEVERLKEELERVSTERDEGKAALLEAEKKFEESIDEVVQSSIQKISHAEEARDEAVKAAEDNYEMVAEAHARLAEKDKLIKELQGR